MQTENFVRQHFLGTDNERRHSLFNFSCRSVASMTHNHVITGTCSWRHALV